MSHGLSLLFALMAIGHAHFSWAQDMSRELTTYRFASTSPSEKVCPKVEADSTSAMGSKFKFVDTVTQAEDSGVIPIDKRQSIGDFQAVNEGKTPMFLTGASKKLRIITLFNTRCHAAAQQVFELAELQPKGEKFGFEIYPVSLHNWIAIKEFRQMNSKMVKDTVFYTPGVGTNGITALNVQVTGLPTTLILDRQGRIASHWAGYEPKRLTERLKKLLVEP